MHISLHTKTIAFCFFILFSLTGPVLLAQQSGPTANTLQPYRIDKEIAITGTLADSVWHNATPVYIEHEIQPNDNAPAPVQTQVKVLYGPKHIYFGFTSYDPEPGKIRASISDRDNSFSDDFVGIFLDPFGNNQQAYEFFVNPLGIQMDGMRTGNNEDMNFDALWYSEGKINDSGYTAVMKIPFQSLNFPQKDVQEWSIQFLRVYPRNSRYQMTWTNASIDNPCLVCQNGRLTELKGLESTNTVELLPYAMSYQNSALADSENPSEGLDHNAINGRVGGSVSYAPTSTSSLNAVINPDFSQVETDAAQIGVNETFALYYSEKRPFFMKGADLFRTREDLFYSRMINRPLAAGKFTKKDDKYTIAFLSAYDRETPYIVPGRYGSSLVRSDVNSYNNILRTKYNLGDESFIGGLITTRNQGEGSNYVGSVDWKLMLADHYYFNGQAGYSNTKELNDPELFDDPRQFGRSEYNAAFNGEQYGGTLISTELERQAKYYGASVSFSSYSPTFQSQGGFINQTDQRRFEAGQSLSYYPDTKWLSQGSVSVSGTWRYDFAGEFQERYVFASLNNNFAGQTQLSLSYLPVNDERFRGRYFKGMRRLMIDLSSKPIDGIAFSGHVDFGKYVNRRENPTLGEGYNASASATIKPTSRMQFDFSYSYSELSAAEAPEQEYYSGDVMRLTSRYNFSRRWFARLITQYDSFADQIQIYPLVYYKANPFTKFYIGMTDYMNHYDQPGGINGYRQTNREFFVKFQYLFRY